MINVQLVDNLKITDNPRLVLVSILNSAKVPAYLKILGYAFLNNANDVDILKLKELFLKVIGYIDSKDSKGLTDYLNSVKMPPEITKMVLMYAANSDKNQ